MVIAKTIGFLCAKCDLQREYPLERACNVLPASPSWTTRADVSPESCESQLYQTSFAITRLINEDRLVIYIF